MISKLKQCTTYGVKINIRYGIKADGEDLKIIETLTSRVYEDVLHYAVDIAQEGFEDAVKIDISRL